MLYDINAKVLAAFIDDCQCHSKCAAFLDFLKQHEKKEIAREVLDKIASSYDKMEKAASEVSHALKDFMDTKVELVQLLRSSGYYTERASSQQPADPKIKIDNG